MKISELTEDQKCHLAWRLEHYTCYGYLTSCAIARGQHGDDELEEVFKKAECSNYKSHARKVSEFIADPRQKLIVDTTLKIGLEALQTIKAAELNSKETAEVLRRLIGTFKQNLSLFEI